VQSAIVKLDNPILHYAWGSHEALARLQGREHPSLEPEAEIWIGDHRVAPSRVVDGGETVLLPDWIAADPEGVLGVRRGVRRGAQSTCLPFLAKLLAAARPLSVQVHPDAEQARAGFGRERSAAVPEAQRCYRDANPKHEILVALGPFEALCGLRADEDVDEAIAAVPALGSAFTDDAALPKALCLLKGLLHLDQGGVERVLADLKVFAAGESREAGLCSELLAEHPGDPLATAPLLLEHVSLESGQALVVPPGTLHSYLSGLGLEVMTPSDNVIRAGLTRKHVDRHELLAVASPRARGARVLDEPERDADGVAAYDTGTAAFALRLLDLEPGRAPVSRPGGRATLVLCVEGAVSLSEPRAGGGAPVALAAGEAALVASRAEHFELSAGSRTSRVFEVSSR
jgi:mannose-6-phosphate isomerase